VSLLLLVAIGAVSGRGYTYDEGPYLLDTVALLDEHGLTRSFLLAYPYPAGTLFGLMHWLLRPITQLDPVVVRLVNPALFLLMVAMVGDLLRRGHVPGPPAAAWLMLAVPFTWVLAGMALTELVGMAFATASFWAFVRGTADAGERRTWVRVARALGAGGLLGVAFFSRPPLVLIAAPLGLLALAKRHLWLEYVSFLSAVCVVIGPVIALWGWRLVPPSVDFFSAEAFSFPHALLALGYASLAVVFVCVDWFRRSWVMTAGGFVAGIALNLLVTQLQTTPMAGVVRRVMPAGLEPAYAVAAGSVLAGLALAFVGAAAAAVWRYRRDAAWGAACLSLVLMVAMVGKITHQFSSRYVGVSVTFLVLALARDIRWSAGQLVLSAIGAALGAAILCSYLLL
jgi:hypothetical protein